MAGHMGNKRITTQNLPVVRIDTSLNLIFVKGTVPGVDDAHVLVSGCKKEDGRSEQSQSSQRLVREGSAKGRG